MQIYQLCCYIFINEVTLSTFTQAFCIWKNIYKKEYLIQTEYKSSFTISIMLTTPKTKIENPSESPGELFKFPLSNEGIQSFTSILQMRQTFLHLFTKIYGNHPTIKWTFYFVRTKLWKQLNRKYKQKMQQIWKMRCHVCTNIIIYGKKSGGKQYQLLNINYYHMHATNINKYINHLKYNDKFRYIVKAFDNRTDCNADEKTIIEFMRNLPPNILKTTAYWVVNKYFSISQKYFFYLLKKVNEKKEISFKELIHKLKKQSCQVSYLPKDLLSSHSSNTFTEQMNPQEFRDKINPHLPNILIIVTPEMKEQYKAFGQWVGFDLTFSVISERTEDNGEYMLGIFGGINSSKKIVIFGLVVTNSQSSFAYSFLFKQFFKIMGSVPDIIITDEQKAIYYSLRHLKKEGIFKGNHLFDMFHMLRKFRKKSYESQTFQLIRKLMHSKDRLEYRSIFKTLQQKIVNDKELELLRNLDLNCQYYSYAQTPPKFTGIGISNNINQYFHSQIKNQIRHATKLTKSVQIVLDLIAHRIDLSRKALVTDHSIERFLNIPFMKPFKSSVSMRTFNYMLKEVTQASMLRILTFKEELARSYSEFISQKQILLKRQKYYVLSQYGVYLVELKRNSTDPNGRQKDGKWVCNCEHSERCGYPCSHLSKILTFLNLDFHPYIHKRWLLDPSSVLAFLQDEQSRIKLKKRYSKNIHKDSSQQNDLFFSDVCKKLNIKNQKKKDLHEGLNAKKLNNNSNLLMELQYMESMADCDEDTRDFSADCFEQDESIVQKEVENQIINLVEPTDDDELIDLKNYRSKNINHHLIESGKIRDHNGIISTVQKTLRANHMSRYKSKK